MPHEVRDHFPSRSPVHITIRLVDGIQLRDPALLPIIHEVIATSQCPDFRIVEFNCESNHMHSMNEANGPTGLGRGMRRFEGVLARYLNRALGRHGPVFADRYHARALESPREVRNALRYILNNARHHAADAGRELDPSWFDPFSSAPWFTGWAEPIEPYSGWTYELLRQERPTAEPTTWLLRTGWMRHGLIGVAEVPGVRLRRCA
jgi:REP element-mobilizing transposase RayT